MSTAANLARKRRRGAKSKITVADRLAFYYAIVDREYKRLSAEKRQQDSGDCSSELAEAERLAWRALARKYPNLARHLVEIGWVWVGEGPARTR